MKKYAFETLFPKDKKFLYKGKAHEYNLEGMGLLALGLSIPFLGIMLALIAGGAHPFNLLVNGLFFGIPVLILLAAEFIARIPCGNIDFAFDNALFYFRKGEGSKTVQSCALSRIADLKIEKNGISFREKNYNYYFPNVRRIRKAFSELSKAISDAKKISKTIPQAINEKAPSAISKQKKTISGAKKRSKNIPNFINKEAPAVFSTVTGYYPKDGETSDSLFSINTAEQNKTITFNEEEW